MGPDPRRRNTTGRDTYSRSDAETPAHGDRMTHRHASLPPLAALAKTTEDLKRSNDQRAERLGVPRDRKLDAHEIASTVRAHNDARVAGHRHAELMAALPEILHA